MDASAACGGGERRRQRRRPAGHWHLANPCATAVTARLRRFRRQRRYGPHRSAENGRHRPRSTMARPGRALDASAARRAGRASARQRQRPQRRRHRGDRRRPGRRGSDRAAQCVRPPQARACASPATARAATTSRGSTARSARRSARALTLTDDDSAQVDVPFAFSFYGRTQTTAFVNSDGNVTFEEGDHASTERNVARLLTGPPRVAPFLADLDPTTGGRIYVERRRRPVHGDVVRRPRLRLARTVTAQATLLPERRHRDEVRRPVDARRRRRRRLAGPYRRLHACRT